jgi:predicted lipoprotein with Yx(FWY)xxD motif
MKRSVLSILTVSGLLLLAGCGVSKPGARSYALKATDIQGLGRILVDGAGYSLYVYLPDNQGPSRCVSVCAEAWPPLVLPGGVQNAIAGPGVDAALVGTTRRSNGSLQVTYNRWPLYLYIDDGRGQVNGQGEGMGAWYALSTSGAVDRQPVASSNS